MKKSGEFQLITHSAFFKKVKNKLELHCDFCAPNKGCNRDYKNKYGKPVSWKKNRLMQYK